MPQGSKKTPPLDTQAIVSWAEGQAQKPAQPANTPKYDRLTRSDIGLMLKLRKDGLTQAEIAQRLGCNQPTVSKWLGQFTDSTDHAKEYLRGQALRMAKNIVHKGLARDHVAALKGLNVLEEQQNAGVIVQIGVSVDMATPTLSPLVLDQSKRRC
jgi:predicted transcriptional regulator